MYKSSELGNLIIASLHGLDTAKADSLIFGGTRLEECLKNDGFRILGGCSADRGKERTKAVILYESHAIVHRYDDSMGLVLYTCIRPDHGLAAVSSLIDYLSPQKAQVMQKPVAVVRKQKYLENELWAGRYDDADMGGGDTKRQGLHKGYVTQVQLFGIDEKAIYDSKDMAARFEDVTVRSGMDVRNKVEKYFEPHGYSAILMSEDGSDISVHTFCEYASAVVTSCDWGSKTSSKSGQEACLAFAVDCGLTEKDYKVTTREILLGRYADIEK